MIRILIFNRLTNTSNEKDSSKPIINEHKQEESKVPLVTQNSNLTSDASPSKKEKLKIDLSKVDPIGIKILVELTRFILANKSNKIFNDHVFEQNIQSKGIQKTVDLINAGDFFETLEIYGIITNPIKSSHRSKLEASKEQLKELLCIDPKYTDLLLLLKINRVIAQINSNKEAQEIAKNAKYIETSELSQEQDNDSSNGNIQPEYEYDDEFMENDQSDDDGPTPDKSHGYVEESVEQLEDDDYKEESFDQDQEAFNSSKAKLDSSHKRIDTEGQVYSEEFDNKSYEKSSSNVAFGNVKDFSDLHGANESDSSADKNYHKDKKIIDDDVQSEIEDEYQF